MRTTLSIDDGQVQELMRCTGQSSPVSAIRHALDDYLRQSRKRKVLALRGQIQMDDNWRQLRALEVDRDSHKGAKS